MTRATAQLTVALSTHNALVKVKHRRGDQLAAERDARGEQLAGVRGVDAPHEGVAVVVVLAVAVPLVVPVVVIAIAHAIVAAIAVWIVVAVCAPLAEQRVATRVVRRGEAERVEWPAIVAQVV